MRRVLVLESSALTLALTQGTKHPLRRERPWAHFADPPTGERLGSRESALSFVSGHASLSFTLAVATGSLASLRGDDGKEWVWVSGLTSAAATAYLRIAADRHYLTDVIAGAAAQPLGGSCRASSTAGPSLSGRIRWPGSDTRHRCPSSAWLSGRGGARAPAPPCSSPVVCGAAARSSRLPGGSSPQGVHPLHPPDRLTPPGSAA